MFRMISSVLLVIFLYGRHMTRVRIIGFAEFPLFNKAHGGVRCERSVRTRGGVRSERCLRMRLSVRSRC